MLLLAKAKNSRPCILNLLADVKFLRIALQLHKDINVIFLETFVKRKYFWWCEMNQNLSLLTEQWINGLWRVICRSWHLISLELIARTFWVSWNSSAQYQLAQQALHRERHWKINSYSYNEYLVFNIGFVCILYICMHVFCVYSISVCIIVYIVAWSWCIVAVCVVLPLLVDFSDLFLNWNWLMILCLCLILWSTFWSRCCLKL